METRSSFAEALAAACVCAAEANGLVPRPSPTDPAPAASRARKSRRNITPPLAARAANSGFLPPTAYCPLPTAHCLLPTAYCPPLSADHPEAVVRILKGRGNTGAGGHAAHLDVVPPGASP